MRLAITLILVPAAALAVTGAPPDPVDHVGFEVEHARALSPFELEESQLILAGATTEMPPNWNGDIDVAEDMPEWIRKSLDERERYLQPLLVSGVAADLAIRLHTFGGVDNRASLGEVEQTIILSMKYLELVVPAVAVKGGRISSADALRLNVRLPFLTGERNAFAATVSVNVPFGESFTRGGGVTTFFGYALGTGAFTAQARAGVGVDRLAGDFGASIHPCVQGDFAFGIRPLPRIQGVLQLEAYAPLDGAPGQALRVWPVLRIFPTGSATMSIGLGAQVWLNELPDGWGMRRAGALLELGYAFL